MTSEWARHQPAALPRRLLGAAAGGPASRSEPEQAIVLIVDDDAAVREALQDLLQSVGLRAQPFASTAEFLESTVPDAASCLVLDIRLPGLSGLEFQVRLAAANIHTPIIFMTGYGDIPMTVRAMKAGAVDFLTKPFRAQDMLDAVASALARDRVRREAERRAAEMGARFGALSARQREVMALVTSGLMNKQVAAQTGLAETTVKIHRGQVMRKMQARSLAELVRMAGALGMHRTSAGSPLRPASAFEDPALRSGGD